jgi:hypothetical protein
VANTRWRSTCRLKSGIAAICLCLSNCDAESLSATLTVLVALVTVDAVVDVSRNLIMMEIVRVVPAMAAGALKDRVVVRVDVAGGANIVGSAVVRGKLRVLRVVERRAGPCCRVVAVLARRGEELRLGLVSRIRRLVVVVRMAAIARGRQRGVVAVHVAIGALSRWYRVGAREGEGCVVVIEGGVRPHVGVVAELAGGWEAR